MSELSVVTPLFTNLIWITCSHTKSFGPHPEKSDSLSRIISPHHASRIKALVDNTKGNVILGGEVNVEERYVAPTVVRDLDGDDSLLSEYVLLCHQYQNYGTKQTDHFEGRSLGLSYLLSRSTMLTMLSISLLQGPFILLKCTSEIVIFITNHSRDHPLALYIFTQDKKVKEKSAFL